MYIWQNLINNTNVICSTNITKTRNFPILNRFKMLKYFWQALKYFYIMWHSLIRQLACSQVKQQLASWWTVSIIFSIRGGMLETRKQALLFNFEENLSCSVIRQYKLSDLIKIYDDFVNDPVKGSEAFVTISDRQKKFGGILMAWSSCNMWKFARFIFYDR